MKKKAIILDIDGTLAICSKRRELAVEAEAAGGSFWDVFFDPELIAKDTVNKPVYELYWAMLQQKYKIIIMTGRTGYEGVEEVTRTWLNDNHIFWDEFYMRTAGDKRDDTVVKKEFYDKVKDKYDIVFAVDDRDRVVKLWRELGLCCLQCEFGNF